MTTTSEYLNEFTPDWPYGHVIVTRSGSTRPFVVKVTNWPGKFPIWGHIVGDEGSWCFRADGGSDSGYRLRNAAPPKRVPREHWMNYYSKCESTGPFGSRKAADAEARTMFTKPTECVRFREVIEEAATETEEELPKRFDIEEAKAALITCADIYCAFDWSITPQGGEFWEGYFNNELSPEDTARAREALKRWIAIAGRRAAK